MSKFGSTGDEFLRGFDHYRAEEIRKLAAELPGLAEDAVYQELVRQHGDSSREVLTHLRAMTTSPEACPQCSSERVLPIVWGMPTPEIDAMRGKVVIGGCMVHGPNGVEKDPAFECRDCGHRFGAYDWKGGAG